MKRRVAWFMAVAMVVTTPMSSVLASDDAAVIIEDTEDVIDIGSEISEEMIEKSESETEEVY